MSDAHDPADLQPITFVVPGQALAGGVDPAAATRGTPAQPSARPGRVKAAVRVAALRGAADVQRLVAVPGEDIVALHVAGGPVLYLHPANARDLLLAQAAAGATRDRAASIVGAAPPPAEVAVSAALRWRDQEPGAPTRGLLGDVVLAAVEVLTGLAKDEAADFAAGRLVQQVDAQVDAGLYALAPEALAPLAGSGLKVTPEHPLPPAETPLLVLIHGTFVETVSTFGKLWALHPERVRELFAHYRGRVCAFDHETLGKSPIANALTLAQALPAGARLHLATHSRGGLVAEVLARVAHTRAVDAADLAFFAAPEYARHRSDLQALAVLLAQKDITVERIVRVACPARGTLLASRRLDAYLSVLKWSLEALGVPLAPACVDFLIEVARRRARPEQIPGLEAMIPGTPLVEWLNAAPDRIAGELRVVAGDLQGDSVGSWIKTLLADAYYWTDNDIVVQTRSMYGGAPRAGGASFLLDRGGKTTHFAYFANPATVDAVVDGLMQPEPPAGFAPIGPLSWAGEDAGGTRGLRGSASEPDKPAVFVLPGILGSNLQQGGRRVWLALALFANLDTLAYRPGGADGVAPDGPIELVYGKLIDHLAATHEVQPFAFDWRRPIEEEAQRLAVEIDRALDARAASRQPVRLLAHSMGGLVVRALALERPATWQRLLAHPAARVLMLGTPNGGSYAPMQVLSGDDTFGNLLAAFGSPLRDHHARELMAAMPGFIQLQADLTDPARGLDTEATWRRLAEDDYARTQQQNWWHRSAGEAMEPAYRWGVPSQAVLDAAVALRRRLDAQRAQALPAFADRIVLVVGHARSTPVGYEVDADSGFVYLDSGDGDGRVALASALLPGVQTWSLDCEHGSLPSAKGAFDAYVELLERGSTERLARLPAARGAAPAAALVRSRPSRQGAATQPPRSQDTVFGAAPEAAVPAPARGAALQLELVNGNLAFIGEPLLLGHYRSTELSGTEAVVDRLLGGSMSAALAAGIYPEERAAHRVFVNGWRDPVNPWALPRPLAAVVLGLGDEGTLRESDLADGVCQAVLGWAQRLAEERARSAASTSLAATLLGSGGLGISAGAAARAIARGVYEANRRLAHLGWPRVERLVLVELYLDRATEAWQGLQVLAAASPEAFVLAPRIRSGTGALRQPIAGSYRGADYDLITAVTREAGTIEFALDSRRARSELREQPTQIGLVRDLVLRAASDRSDAASLGRTLFRLLVPLEMRPFLGGTDRMVLDLDASTAAIPWELLDAGQTAAGSDARPWAVRARLLRRLRKSVFRAAPRDADALAHVLLVGAPKVDADSGYGPLPAARDEALAVQDALTEAGGLPGEQVLALVDEPDAVSVVSALLERPWRIVHIAGHGESRADGARGVVLSNHRFLGRAEIRAMDVVPELVFLNCCHLGAFGVEQVLRGDDPPRFAANMADQLIDIGVRCVVAAGWAVDDEPAQTFARALYGALLRPGTRFIDAVSEAREACWRRAPHSNTWAAYQCYGDPNWVLRRDGGDAQAPRTEDDEFATVASPPALALALETLAVQSRFMGKPAEVQQGRLRQLEARFAGVWGSIGAVAEAFGVAWEAAAGRDQAIGWLDKAVHANDASASLHAEEMLENLRARRAWAQAAAQAEGAARTPRLDRAIASALAALAALAERRPTAERLNLLGSAHKRDALMLRRAGDAAGERHALRAALAAYRRGLRQGSRDGVADRFYPALNCLALELVLRHAPGAPRRAAARPQARSTGSAGWAGSVRLARSALTDKSQRDPDFWSQVGWIELALYEALAAARLPERAEALADAWAEVHARVDNAAWWSSVADQADLVLDAAMHHGSAEERAAAGKLWAQLAAYGGRQGKPDADAGQHAKPPPGLVAGAPAAPSATLRGHEQIGLAMAAPPQPVGAEPPASGSSPELPEPPPAPAADTRAAVSAAATLPDGSLPGTVAPRTLPTPEAEPVDAAVYCPPRVARGSSFLVQVLLFAPARADEAAARAREADAAAERRQQWSLPLDLAPGTRVDLHLEMPGLTLAEPDSFVVWRRGGLLGAQFEVGVPADAVGDAGGNAIGRLRFAIDGVPVGTMRFQVAIVAAGAPSEAPAAAPAQARRYRQAFVSYASKDRAEVLRRVQAFKIAGLTVFQDVLDLDPGERWERRLYLEIDRCDVFMLFWSNAARASEWVAKEIDYALARKGGRDDAPPAIQPVPIEGPPIAPPPEALRGLHFNDALLAPIAAADASRPAAAPPPRQP